MKQMKLNKKEAKAFWLAMLFACIFSLLLGLLAEYFIPAFHEIHQVFSHEQLGWFTSFFHQYRKLLWICMYLLAGIWLVWPLLRLRPHAHHYATRAFHALGITASILIVMVVWAMYAPAIHG